MSLLFFSCPFSLAFNLGLGFDFKCLEVFHLVFLWPHLYAWGEKYICLFDFPLAIWPGTFLMCMFNIFFLVFSQWCLLFPPHSGATTHRETRVHLWWFLANNWKDFQVEHLLSINLCNSSFSNLSPLGKHPFLKHTFRFGFALAIMT